MYLVGIFIWKSWGENEVENAIIGLCLGATSTPDRSCRGKRDRKEEAKWTTRLTGFYILSCSICVSELWRVTAVRRIRSGKSVTITRVTVTEVTSFTFYRPSTLRSTSIGLFCFFLPSVLQWDSRIGTFRKDGLRKKCKAYLGETIGLKFNPS